MTELEALKAENRQLRDLLRRIHTATKQFYVPKDMTPDCCPYNDILALYHKILSNLPVVRKLGAKRKTAMRARWKDDLPTLADWAEYFKDASRKPFLFGRNDRGWVATIDFLLREDAVIKMQEGTYNERK
ncbi:MAG: hypothetical protein WBC75_09360 [Dehalococcoidales bacterium]